MKSSTWVAVALTACWLVACETTRAPTAQRDERPETVERQRLVEEPTATAREQIAREWASYRERVSALAGVESVRATLEHLAKLDQMVRRDPIDPVLLAEVDAANAARLEEIIERYGWPTLSEYGEQANHDAWLIAQHGPEPLQRRVLALMKPLLGREETAPQGYAYLYDRVHALVDGGEQRFGTQGQCGDTGSWEPLPLEDPAQVDQLRASVGLGPMQENIDRLSAGCL